MDEAAHGPMDDSVSATPQDSARSGPAPTSGALTGKRIVVTRARSQASGLVQRLADLNATVVELPVIEIEGPADGGAALAASADRLADGAYAWVVVTSANAVVRMFEALDGRPVPPSTRWAAVGTSTARSLTQRETVAALVPETAVSDALVDAFPTASDAPGANSSVLFVRAERVRDVVVPGLVAKGWSVDEAIAYRTVAGAPDPDAVAAAKAADVVAFTSSSTVERTIDLLGASGVPAVIASIGPITSASVRAAGLVVTAEAAEHTLDGLVAAVVTALS